YKRALAAYAKKRGRRATTVSEDESLPSFSREPATRHEDAPTGLPFDEEALSARVRNVSARFKSFPDLFDASVKIGVDRVTRYFVNSEGSQVITERTLYSCHLAAATRAKDGM